jgi:hypothetical protein
MQNLQENLKHESQTKVTKSALDWSSVLLSLPIYCGITNNSFMFAGRNQGDDK